MSTLAIASRASWGARHRDGFGSRTVGRLDKFLHHDYLLGTAAERAGADATVEQEREHMRRLDDIGQNRFGGGISYTIVVFRSGRAYWGHSIGRVGAHTGGRNSTSVGIALVGSYMTVAPSAAQERTVAAILQHGVAQAWWVQPILTGGHRDTKATSCPGDRAYARIPAINTLGRGGAVTQPSQTLYAMGWPDLRLGKRGAEVLALQNWLNLWGAGLDPDGDFGPATDATVKTWQTQHGLSGNGVVAKTTQAAMKASTPPKGHSVMQLNDKVDHRGWDTAIGRRFGNSFTVQQHFGYSAEAYFQAREATRAAERNAAELAKQSAKQDAILAAVTGNQVTAQAIAEATAGLLLPNLAELVTEAVTDSEGRSAEEIGAAVVAEMADRLRLGAGA